MLVGKITAALASSAGSALCQFGAFATEDHEGLTTKPPIRLQATKCPGASAAGNEKGEGEGRGEALRVPLGASARGQSYGSLSPAGLIWTLCLSSICGRELFCCFSPCWFY